MIYSGQESLAASVDTWVPGGKLSDGFGDRKRNGVTESHPGIDIYKVDGTGKLIDGFSVKAGCKGEVVKVYGFQGKHFNDPTAAPDDILSNFNGVLIKCTEKDSEFEGKFILFLHFKSISVTEGQAVNADTEVGKAGGYGKKSAKTFPTHVHIEVREPDADDEIREPPCRPDKRSPGNKQYGA